MRFLLSVLVAGISSVLLAQNPGDLDLSFDGDGKLVIADIDSMSDPFAMPTSDLGLIIGFNRTVDGQQQTCLLRLYEDGSVNTGFGDAGLFEYFGGIEVKKVLINSSDQIYFVGRKDGQICIDRFNGSAEVDMSYGINGRWQDGLDGINSEIVVSGAILNPDDRIFVSGNFGVRRIMPTGGFDPEFSPNGYLSSSGVHVLGNGDLMSYSSPNRFMRSTYDGDSLYAGWLGGQASGSAHLARNIFDVGMGWGSRTEYPFSYTGFSFHASPYFPREATDWISISKRSDIATTQVREVVCR